MNRVLFNTSASITAASVVTLIANFGGRFIGYAREAATANFFGTSAALDLFILSFTIPELLVFVIFAAFPTAFIPARKHLSVTDGQLFWRGLWSYCLLLLFLTLPLLLFAEQFTSWLGGNLTSQQMSTVKSLMYLFGGYLVFRGLEVYFRSWLYEKKEFVVPAVSTALVNVVVLSVMVFFWNSMTIWVLAFSWLAGAFVVFVYNGFAAFKRVIPGPVTFQLKGTNHLYYVFLGIAAIELLALVYPVIDRYFAANFLGEGNVAALRYATFLAHIPTGIIAGTISLAAFPWISDHLSEGQKARLRHVYLEGMRVLIFIMLLVAVGVAFFAEEIVRVAYQRGQFEETSLNLTTGPLFFLALGLPFYSAYFYQMRFYYAAKATRRLALIFVGMLLFKLLLSYLLVGPMQQNGLALATALTWFFGFCTMTVDLQGRINVSARVLFSTWLPQVLLSLFGSTIIVLFLSQALRPDSDSSLLGVFLFLAMTGVVAIVLYVVLAKLLRVPEADRIMRLMKRR